MPALKISNSNSLEKTAESEKPAETRVLAGFLRYAQLQK